MRKTFSNRQYTRRPSNSLRHTVVLCVGLAILIGGVVFIGIQYKRHPENFPVTEATLSRFKQWLSREKVESETAAKSTQLAEEESVAKKIHFEFYTTLPNMRVAATKPLQQEKIPAANVNKIVAEPAQKTAEVKPNSITNPADLERDIANQLAQQPYVVQLGVFGNIEAANGYKDALHRAGYKVDVVKIAMNGKLAYRVQFGPFSTKDQARDVQKQLQKKNVNGLVRKALALQ